MILKKIVRAIEVVVMLSFMILSMVIQWAWEPVEMYRTRKRAERLS
jgi:hypothetical protein